MQTWHRSDDVILRVENVDTTMAKDLTISPREATLIAAAKRTNEQPYAAYTLKVLRILDSAVNASGTFGTINHCLRRSLSVSRLLSLR
ncbi:hypothetical protein OK016_25005 [Vibrio chagasii]|nr:hypothetical protein [Vibrio chagasii]